MGATNQDTYANPAWDRGFPGSRRSRHGADPSANSPWQPVWGFGRPAVIAMTVLAFLVWWPIGLATLFYLIGSGRVAAPWSGARGWNRAQGGRSSWNAWPAWACGGTQAPGSSGNHAFDEYRMETLKRMEEEQQEFGAFLERLRFAKDKAEFDQFMAERRSRPTPPADGEQATA